MVMVMVMVIVLGMVLQAGALEAELSPEEARARDKIHSLPGLALELELDDAGRLPFQQYAGYFHINNRHGFFEAEVKRELFYWFVESSGEPPTDPIVFWTNGGPGCSGLLGFLSEMGPFRPTKDGGLQLNPYSWNQRANMVFIESPEGVGFSHSDADTDFADDRSTAILNHKIITMFIERFPQFKSNDLYLASESYGGHYLPTLAVELVQDKTLNFKGFSVGNPFTTLESGDYSFFNTAWGHQMIALPTWTQFEEECKDVKRPDLERCASLEIEMHIQMGKLNPYAIDFPSCVPNDAVQSDQLLRTLASSSEHSNKRERRSPLLTAKGLKNKIEYQPCEDDYVTRYLNRLDVQIAIHAATSESDLKPWKKCSTELKYSHFDSQMSMVPIYKQLLADPYLDVSSYLPFFYCRQCTEIYILVLIYCDMCCVLPI
jgi:carboxypeptidase C (cathepsin A)